MTKTEERNNDGYSLQKYMAKASVRIAMALIAAIPVEEKASGLTRCAIWYAVRYVMEQEFVKRAMYLYVILTEFLPLKFKVNSQLHQKNIIDL